MPGAENKLTDGNKNRLRTSIIQGAINFEQYLNNKTFLILCEDNSQTHIRFFQDDYKHLTGIYSDLDDTHTTVFPVAIRNDEENICVGFVDDIHKARSLRNAKNSCDADSEKQIIAILGKTNGREKFEETVYIKNGYELGEENAMVMKKK